MIVNNIHLQLELFYFRFINYLITDLHIGMMSHYSLNQATLKNLKVVLKKKIKFQKQKDVNQLDQQYLLKQF